MKPIKVNADYEIALFERRASPEIINHSLEFLALYLEELPLCSSKEYKQEFLEHVESLTGRKPEIVKSKEWINWWGNLSNISLEQKLNSKEFTAGLTHDSHIITALEELKIEDEKKYLAKNPFGMSGQNLIVFKKGEESKLESLLQKTKKLVIEPYLERVADFAHYVLPDGGMIGYENIVDQNFQYKGTIFNDLSYPSTDKLSFFGDISAEEWDKFHLELNLIVKEVMKSGVKGGYSIDSFTYKTKDGIKIRTACEINYRKTMGLMAWLLSKKYSQKKWSLFILGKSLKKENAFSYVQNLVRNVPGCLHLSPGDTRFEMFLLSADTREEGLRLMKTLKELLPDCQFSI